MINKTKDKNKFRYGPVSDGSWPDTDGSRATLKIADRFFGARPRYSCDPSILGGPRFETNRYDLALNLEHRPVNPLGWPGDSIKIRFPYREVERFTNDNKIWNSLGLERPLEETVKRVVYEGTVFHFDELEDKYGLCNDMESVFAVGLGRLLSEDYQESLLGENDGSRSEDLEEMFAGLIHDVIVQRGEYLHPFSSEKELRKQFKKGRKLEEQLERRRSSVQDYFEWCTRDTSLRRYADKDRLKQWALEDSRQAWADWTGDKELYGDTPFPI